MAIVNVARLQTRMEAFNAAIRGGCSTVKDAAAKGRVPRREVYRWIRKGELGEEPYATWLQDYMAAMVDQKQEYLAAIREGAHDDWRAAAWLVERLDGRTDEIQEAWGELTDEEALAALAEHPEIKRLVLEGEEPAKALPSGGDDDGR